MVRSWEERVRGASMKARSDDEDVEPAHDAADDRTDAADDSEAAVDDRRDAPDQVSETEAVESAHTTAAHTTTAPDETGSTDDHAPGGSLFDSLLNQPDVSVPPLERSLFGDPGDSPDAGTAAGTETSEVEESEAGEPSADEPLADEPVLDNTDVDQADVVETDTVPAPPIRPMSEDTDDPEIPGGPELPEGIVVDRRAPKPHRDLDLLTGGPFADVALVTEGLALAVSAVHMSVVVVERSTGLILWSSAAWVERFGEKDLLARHLPSTTEFGESPLPAPGESWRRTRTITFADGAEDLVELVLIGSATESGVEFATVVALDRSGTGPVVSDRAEVISVVEGAIEAAADGSVAVLYVDLDRFKVVHDLVGNIEALRLLDLVNRRISASVRGADLVFRLPSDEFVIIACELTDLTAAEELAERIRVGVATLADVGNDMALTASVGVAVSEGAMSGDELVAASETAVYLAKGRGRNRIAVHDEELRTRTQRLMVVERQLRRAIERRDVRFAYQPVVEMATGRVMGAEALLRLGGEVGLSAVEVVAAAEQSGLMGVLGALVLEGVDEQLDSLLRGPVESGTSDRLVMVNVSAPQLADESLIQALTRLVEDDSIPAGRLAIEVPEIVLRDHRRSFAKVAELIRPKFKIGVDGFGTGVGDFDLIDEAPIDYIKLHRSITTAIAHDETERARLAATIERAQSKDFGVVALGVERPDQVRALRSVGCRLAQGFLYAGAVTSDELMGLLVSGFPLNADTRP